MKGKGQNWNITIMSLLSAIGIKTKICMIIVEGVFIMTLMVKKLNFPLSNVSLISDVEYKDSKF